ncbi:nuclear transport factor 2 family protein [Curvivirga sp.]|uniref:nuclear transport factor 2 family protein n=1 Tax=Curvivirga sp. TaxID=2856848 RepID=UPI003B5B70D5
MPAPKEFAAIRKVLHNYMEGSYAADLSLLRSVFYPEASMSGFMGDQLEVGTTAPFYEELQANKSSKESGEAYHAEIGYIHITGKAASASVIEDNLLGRNYVNHFHLLKIESDWKIISKTYVEM